MTRTSRALQQRAGAALFARVAGPDATAVRARIHDTPGPRWFEPGSAIHRVHGDASMFVGGLRALLLQSLHPLAMAAVAAHSGYRGDPWGRLQRTSTFIAVTTFGTVDDAEAAVSVVRAVHERVRGAAPDGRAYAASDPDLLRWVHVAEADSFLDAHQRYGARPLDPAGCDEYVAQIGTVARRLGVVDPPSTLADLRATLEAYRPELAPSAAADDAARFLLVDPPIPWFARPGFAALARAAVASMPPWSAPLLRSAGPAVGRRRPATAGGRVTTSFIRWALDPA
ncbi:oxygenase MpaB family protein [Oerskovia flava]|uniref:oxygenase MpaB family protein n=1 Tax=Oerskovia flava TaxID=2986422 RepID=UPI0022407883|nr:oxygenase MpaB family protein [Oerskovia sp. JB1-3-2]